MKKQIAWLLVLALPACEEAAGPGNGGDPGPNDPVEFEVTGMGAVSERHTAEVAVFGSYAYTTTWGNLRQAPGNALKVWDVSGNTPLLVDSAIVPEATTLGDVQISAPDSLLVVPTEFSGGSIVMFDISDPAHPVRVGRHHSSATNPGVHTVKLGRIAGRLYAFLSVSSLRQLVIVDITDPANPVQVTTQTTGTPMLHDVFVRDGLLFTAGWNAGVTIWDIGGGSSGGSVQNPVAIGNVITRISIAAPKGNSARAHNVWWFHDPNSGSKRWLFVGEEGPMSIGSYSEGDIHVVDISDPTSPIEVAFFNVPGAGTHNFWMDEEAGILYAAFYNGGVRALDVTGDLSQCEDSERHTDGRCNLGLMGREVGFALTDRQPLAVWGVVGAGNYLYASDMVSGLFKLDISPLR